MIKSLLFDLGGVCFDINWPKVDEEMRKKFGISSLIRSRYDAEINLLYDKAIRGEISLKKVFEKICEDKGLDVEQVINYYKELYKKYKIPNERVLKLIGSLKEKFKIACSSDTNDIHFLAHEEQEHLKDFDFIFASFKIGKMKRDKGAFDKIVEGLELTPEEILLIDDSEKNVTNAQAHGFKTVKYKNYEDLIKKLKVLGVM